MTWKDKITDYLESTSIHGFSYLSTGRNILEKLLWLIIICTCFTFAGILICQSVEEASLNPVMTNVETVDVREVPFPAITIDSGDPDPMGYAENIFNVLDINGKQLKEEFATELNNLVLKMNSSHQGLDPAIDNLEVQKNICLHYQNAKESIDMKLVDIVLEIFFENQF